MARAIDVRVVPVFRLILYVSRGNRDAALALFGRLVNLIKGNSIAAARAVRDVLPWST